VWVKIGPNYNILNPNVPSREASTEKGTQAWGRGVTASALLCSYLHLPSLGRRFSPRSGSNRSGELPSSLRTEVTAPVAPHRPAGLPVLTSQSALRLSITISRCVSSSQRSRNSCSSSGSSSPIRYAKQPSGRSGEETMQPAHVSLWLRPDTDAKVRRQAED
jgi:hypothetical protein